MSKTKSFMLMNADLMQDICTQCNKEISVNEYNYYKTICRTCNRDNRHSEWEGNDFNFSDFQRRQEAVEERRSNL